MMDFDPGPVPDDVIELEVPVCLCAGVQRCGRCNWSWSPQTWSVRHTAGPICRQCATADPQLRVWQQYCDVADGIDRLMQEASAPELRGLLAQMLTETSRNLSQWRWESAGNLGG